MSYESAVKEDSPKGYLRFGESSGTEVKDASGNALTGTYKNAPTLGVAGALVGDPDTAVSFAAAKQQWVSVPDSATLDLGDILTYEAWIKRASIGTTQTIIDRGAGGMIVRFLTTNKILVRRNGVANICESTTTITDTTTWHHIVVTKNGATVKIYIDGVDRTGAVTNSTLVNNAHVLGIGAADGDTVEIGEWFDGSIDEVAVYGTALSEARVKAHYELGSTLIFNQELTGSSASFSSEADIFMIEELVSGSSGSSGFQFEEFIFSESFSGSSISEGTMTSEFLEVTAMQINGESSSTGSSESSFEASELISGSSSSIGSESESLEVGELVEGSSLSLGSVEQILVFVETPEGTSVSTLGSNDEARFEETATGISASSVVGTIDEAIATEEGVSGSSSSLGSEIELNEYLEPDQPIPAPIEHRGRRRPVVWKFILIDSNTMEELGEIKSARGKQLQLALDKPGGCNFNVPIDYQLFKDVEEINHGILAYRNKEPRYSGMIWNLDESIDGNSIAVQSVGWFETLNHRILRENVGYPPFNTGVVNAGQIVFMPASGSVGTTGYHPGGLLTIASAQHPTWLVEGISSDVMQRIISYQKGQNIGQAIMQLSEIEAGFDFWVDPLTRALDLTSWDSVPDKTNSVVFGYNWGNKNIKQLGRQFDPSVMANRVTALGKYGGGFAEDIESQEKYQLFEEMTQLNDVVDPNVLLGYAGGEVLLRSRPRVLYSFTPMPFNGNRRVPEPFKDYDIGDMVSFTAVRPPRVDIRGQAVRVYGMNIDISDEGNEKVSALQISP